MKIIELERQSKSNCVTEKYFEPAVTIQNRFATLDFENTETTRRENSVESIEEGTAEVSRQENKVFDCEVDIIMDSHRNGMKASKLYRNKTIKLTVLGTGNKNIQGAK